MAKSNEARAIGLLDTLRLGGEVDPVKAAAAQAFAILAVADAINNLASEVGSIGAEAYPIHTREV